MPETELSQANHFLKILVLNMVVVRTVLPHEFKASLCSVVIRHLQGILQMPLGKHRSLVAQFSWFLSVAHHHVEHESQPDKVSVQASTMLLGSGDESCGLYPSHACTEGPLLYFCNLLHHHNHHNWSSQSSLCFLLFSLRWGCNPGPWT